MRRNLGLDELMIVNPAAAPAGQGGPITLPGDFFLDGDGSLYRIEGGPAEATCPPGQFFLGEDGTLYRLATEPDKRKPSR